MENKWLRYGVVSLGIVMLVLIIANFGLNYWLQNNLPSYIKKNSDYQINYANIDVELGTGNILLTKVSVKSKNPLNTKVLGLNGTVDTLQISRFGIYDAAFNNKISSSRLILVNPDLRITLADAKNIKKEREKSPVLARNITIKNGNISLFKPNKSKVFAVEHLNAQVEGIELPDAAEKKLLPLEFDTQKISGKNFYFRPDNAKIFKAALVKTENDLLQIENLQVIPLLSYAQFAKFYPKKNSYFTGSVSKLELKDFNLKNGKVIISSVMVVQPDIKVYTIKNNSDKKKQSFDDTINIEMVNLKQAKVQIYNSASDRIFAGSNINTSISELQMDAETAENTIPFNYKQFKITGNNIETISQNQKINITAVNITPEALRFNNLLFKSTGDYKNKTAINGSLKLIAVDIKEFVSKNKKIKLDVENVTLTGFNGDLHLGKSTSQKKSDFSGIEFPLRIRKVALVNSNLNLYSGDAPLTLNNLKVQVNNVELNATTVKNKVPFKIGTYHLSAKNFHYKIGKYYYAGIGGVEVTEKQMKLSNVVIKPLVSRAQFVREQPQEKDLYDLNVKLLTADGKWDFLGNEVKVFVNKLGINQLDALIFRSKIPNDDLSVKPLYGSMLSGIKFPLVVKNLEIKDSRLIYEEDTKKSDGPGKLIFSHFNLNAQNINSGKMPGKPTKIPIIIKTMLMDSAPLTVRWELDTAKRNDQFTISGYTGDLPAPDLNLFTEPYLKVRTTGNISRLAFVFTGDKKTLSGNFKMVHTDLKVEVLKEEGDKKVLLSAVANLFVKSDSGPNPPAIVLENVERDNTKSFFNFLWKGIEAGLKKSLVGLGASAKKVETTENFPEPAVETAPPPKEVQDTIKEKPAEKGFLKNIFKKKERVEN